LIDRAVLDGWEYRRACRYLELDESRAWRWRARRDAGCLDDRQPGGRPVHGLRPEEVAAILGLFETWGDVDRSHRKLAHRGSYTHTVWVSPATVRRVLAAHGLVLKRPRRVKHPERKPFPEWAEYRRNSIWIYDCTHFAGCPKHAVFAVMDLVTRKWICELVSIEETSTQVQVVFMDALEREELLALVEARQDTVPADTFPFVAENELPPILLAVSDNGPQMTSGSTREFMAMCAIAQHFGRPGTPTDQAWIESLFGHLKADWPHLDRIKDPDVLRAELADVRRQYNTIRLHAGIGYVTPADEHEGRGPRIRAARKRGLRHARWARIAYHRIQQSKANRRSPTDVD
jgi:transposase InsO family protein